MMSTEHKYEVKFTDDGSAILTMRNRENRLTFETLRTINEALDIVERIVHKHRVGTKRRYYDSVQLDTTILLWRFIMEHDTSNQSCRILITTGEGRFYCNGVDLNRLASEGVKVIKDFQDLMADVMWRIMHFALPTVAAINGHCYGGGAFIALCHDYRVMRSDKGWFCCNETAINTKIPTSLHRIVQQKLDSRVIRDLVVFANRNTGPEAKEKGLVDRCTSMENLMTEAKSLGFRALGRNIIDREMLRTMKWDMFPRKMLRTEAKL